MTKRTHPEARIFSVETRFHRVARSGGTPRELAIKQAEVAIEDVKGGFDEWLDGALTELVDTIKQAGAEGSGSDSLQTANSHARQLRDVAMTMGFELLSCIADSLCMLLDSIAAGAEYNDDAVACHLDALSLARQPGYRHLKPAQVPELINGLYRVATVAVT